MPPTLPASLLKAVQCRHYAPPTYIYCEKQPMISRSRFLTNISSVPPRFVNCNSRTRRICFGGGAGRLSSSSSSSPAAAGWRRMAAAAAAGDRIQKEAMGGSLNGSCCKGEKEEEEERRRSKLLTLPTVLTLGRVAAVPLLVSTFYMNGWWATTATTSIFIAAAATDWLDGYIARKMRLGSAFGAFLDPVADKLMVAATLVLLCTKPLDAAIFEGVPWLLTVPSIAIIGREITMSAVREWAASQNSELLKAVAVNNLGKWKTATQMTALTILLIARDSSLTGQDGLAAAGVALLYISAGLALWSLAVYMRKIWRVLLK